MAIVAEHRPPGKEPSIVNMHPRCRPSRRLRLVAVALSGLLALSACGGGNPSGGGEGASGEPVRGGVLRLMQVSEPRSLDPATIVNAQGLGEVVANALYGTLVTNDPATGEIIPGMAESFESTDAGTTWQLTVREGLTFTDGAPLDAEAVMLNWEHIGDPATGAPVASVIQDDIASMKVVDARTLEITLTTPQTAFDATLLTSALNWIASPTALKDGPAAFDQNPVGAGPFKFKSWNRGGAIELVRNDDYYDAPRPYLDGMTISTVADPNQRVDSVAAGDVDLVTASNPAARVRAEQSGMAVHKHPVNGGNILLLNATRPPFDDVRAREALVKAVDQKAINAAIAQGNGEIVDSLFHAEDPYHSGTKVQVHDPERAQELFDELAAEGKPVKLTIHAAINPEIAEAVQTQLRSFDNVDVEVQRVEVADSTSRLLNLNYQALTNGAPFSYPDPNMNTWFHSRSKIHPGRPADAKIDQLIDAARASSDEGERRQLWKQVEERAGEIYAMVWTIRPERAYVARPEVGGMEIYGSGSLAVDGLWIAQ